MNCETDYFKIKKITLVTYLDFGCKSSSEKYYSFEHLNTQVSLLLFSSDFIDIGRFFNTLKVQKTSLLRKSQIF